MNKTYGSLTNDEKNLIDDPKVAESVKRELLQLAELKNQQTFKSTDFKERCIAFLTATPNDFFGVAKTQFADFCENCRKAEAFRVIESITDRYVSSIFHIDSDTLSFIGVQLGKCGFDEDAIRCFVRARDILSE